MPQGGRHRAISDVTIVKMDLSMSGRWEGKKGVSSRNIGNRAAHVHCKENGPGAGLFVAVDGLLDGGRNLHSTRGHDKGWSRWNLSE